MESSELTQGEKDYIFDKQYHHAGHFMNALYEAIGRADENNLYRLRQGFPGAVDAYLAWTRGDLHERASRIAGGTVDYIDPGDYSPSDNGAKVE